MNRKHPSSLSAGDWVEVRSKAEILATLDETGSLDNLPFMPEMFAFCGKRFRVVKRAHKTCDPPNGMQGRRMEQAVHLEDLRCNGEFHGGCQARCLFFWKEQWLRKVAMAQGDEPAPDRSARNRAAGCSERGVLNATRKSNSNADGETIYSCQSTQVHAATTPLQWWDIRQYWEDYTSGNVRITDLMASLFVSIYGRLVASGLGIGSGLTWLYDAVQKLRHGVPYPWRHGEVPPGSRTPVAKLDLQAGELVRIRPYREILMTLDQNMNNRGMSFDAEMIPYCEGTYRVLGRITQIIDEKTGKMQHLGNDCIMLDKVVCLAHYAKYRRFCPRAIYPYWREIWFERTNVNLNSQNALDVAECPAMSGIPD